MSTTGPKGRHDPGQTERLSQRRSATPVCPLRPRRPPLRAARVTVDARSDLGVLDRPWASLGYDEINWTYTPQGRRTLQTIGGFAETPYHVRPHNIFNSGTGLGLPHWGSGNVYHEDADGKPFYDFTIADLTYDAIVGAGHHPLVELAFTPLALVPEEAKNEFPFENSPSQYSAYEAGWWSYPPKDYAKWGGLVAALVEHALERYGVDEVQHWLWELWNEPDISYWRGTPEQFHDLYDVTSRRSATSTRPPRSADPRSPAATRCGLPARLPAGLRRPRPARRLRLLPHQGLALHALAHVRPDRRTGAGEGVAVDPEDAPRDRPRAGRHREFPQYVGQPVIVDECDASVPAHWGIYDNANFAYRNNEYYPVFQAKLMKKVLDLNAQHTAKVHEATTWSFSMEGERYFEGTRSFVTASGIEKPLMNAYRAFAHLGDRRLAATSDQAADISDISALGNGLPEEVDVIASRDSTTQRRDPGLAAHRRPVRRRPEPRPASTSRSTDSTPASGPCSTTGSTTVTATVTRSGRTQGAPQDPTPEQLAAITARQGLERFADDAVVEIDGGFNAVGPPATGA